MPARWATAVIRIERVDADPDRHGEDGCDLRVLVRVQVGVEGRSAEVLGPDVTGRAGVRSLLASALDRIFADLTDSSPGECVPHAPDRHPPGRP